MKDDKYTTIVTLGLPEIKADIMQMYMKTAKEQGYKKIHFKFGKQTQVQFSVLIF